MQKEKQDPTLLGPDELEEQLQSVMSFLSAVHPTLVSEEGRHPCIELRPILHGEYEHRLVRSCNIWDFSEKNVSRLRTFLKRHNGAPTCLFYSVFSYDNHKKSKTADGKLASPGKITCDSAQETNEIVLDFDDIGFDEYTQLVDRFEQIGLYALWVATGHGYHAHLLLKSPLRNKDILRRLVHKFRSKGFDCDPRCVDPARVMRLPGTFNKKYLKNKAYEKESAAPKKCEMTIDTNTRYDIYEILFALDNLPTVKEEDEFVLFERTVQSTAAPSVSEPNAQEHVPNNDPVASDAKLNRIEYPYIQDYDLPPAVQRILSYVPTGYRNGCLGFLIKFLRQNFRLGKEQLHPILTVWAREACDPPYDPAEFERDFQRLSYNYNGLSYTSYLAKRFGRIDYDQIIHLRKQDILIPNKFFRSLRELDGTAVRLYLGIRMLEHVDEDATQTALSELLNISTRALRPTVQSLEKGGFVYRVNGNRRLGVPFSYKTNQVFSSADGFMRFSYNDIRAYVTELYEEGSRANGALKLFLFFHYKFYTKDIYMSQEKLGEHIGVERTTVSRMVDKLQELHFIKVRKVKRSVIETCEYTLLR